MNPAARPRRSPAGFTLVELLIVVLILSIASALVVPMFRDSQATQLRSAARLLAADLDAAKVESLSHADDPRVIAFDLDANTYHIAAVSTPETPIVNVFDKKAYQVQFGHGRARALPDVRLVSADVGADDQLGFGIYGNLDQTEPAVITLGAGDGRVTLTLDPDTGETTISALQ